MKLREYQGKEVFRKYNIDTPTGIVVSATPTIFSNIEFPVYVKAQTTSGNRLAGGGIIVAKNVDELKQSVVKLIGSEVGGEEVKELLIETKLNIVREYYLSVTYSTDTRTPILLFSENGGSGVSHAEAVELNILDEDQNQTILSKLKSLGISRADDLTQIAEKLWLLFKNEKALLVEINPLAETNTGELVAVDAKIILDDSVVQPKKRSELDLGGDIAIIASGGGASMLNIDTLVRSGGRPANYVEYSGNPPASVVDEITLSVLSRSGLRGAWVVGGTANFTDIYETMVGFVSGLKRVSPKPSFPIVIRRDGPRASEAREMLRKFAQEEGYNISVYGPEISMAESANILMQKTKQ